MANQNIGGLTAATLPLATTDNIIVSRGGTIANRATIGDLQEITQDVIGASVVAASNSTLSVAYDDPSGLTTISRSEPIVSGFTSRALAATDNYATIIPTDAAQTATINTGLATGFGCFFTKNATVTAGAGVTVTDNRVAGATNPSFAVIAVGANAYILVGSKT